MGGNNKKGDPGHCQEHSLLKVMNLKIEAKKTNLAHSLIFFRKSEYTS